MHYGIIHECRSTQFTIVYSGLYATPGDKSQAKDILFRYIYYQKYSMTSILQFCKSIADIGQCADYYTLALSRIHHNFN